MAAEFWPDWSGSGDGTGSPAMQPGRIVRSKRAQSDERRKKRAVFFMVEAKSSGSAIHYGERGGAVKRERCVRSLQSGLGRMVAGLIHYQAKSSAGIGDAAEENTGAAFPVLDGEEERVIDMESNELPGVRLAHPMLLNLSTDASRHT